MNRIFLHSILSALLLTGISAAAVAQQTATLDVPRTISYQGLLTAGDGTPIPDGRYDITVTLYADEAGSQAVWRHTYGATVLGGIFNLYLGSEDAPLPAPADMNRPLWIGTAVNGTDQMTPLTPLTSSPYALNLPDNAVTTSKLSDGAVTAEKVDMPYVAGVRVNGQDVSGRATVLSIQSGKDIDVRYDDLTESVVIESRSETVAGDQEKGPGVLDVTFLVSNNWLGRNAGANQPFYTVPNMASSTYNTLGGGRTNNIQDNADYSTITGGQDNVVRDGGDYDFIGGGQINIINDNSNYNCITCGRDNQVGTNSEGNAIVGGGENRIDDDANYNFLGGGLSNQIMDFADKNVVAGGQDNTVSASSDWNAIGGGFTNTIANLSLYNVIGGGNTNTINPGQANTIGGGANNATGVAGGTADYATVSGGQQNVVTASHSAIGGGQDNSVTSTHSVVGGGILNIVNAPLATIGGGGNNLVTATAPEATIAGGHINRIEAYVGAITGGHDNVIGLNGEAGFIGGGRMNNVDAARSAIGGGEMNTIIMPAMHSFIGGGMTNSIEANLATIGGGGNNLITITAPEATIAGGHVNRIESYVGAIIGGHDNIIGPGSEAGVIGGGRNNFVDARMATIGGGQLNAIPLANDWSFIGGGIGNAVFNVLGTIGGGDGNVVNADRGTIPGGDLLLTNASYAQSAMGFYNAPRGAVGFRPAAGMLTNDPLFMIGNGNVGAAVRSNAFEVSYNGHSVVYHNNGSGVLNAAIRGATYTDNIIYGWGEIAANGGVTCDFGVLSVQHVANSGVYRITLNNIAPAGGATAINCGAVVATLGTGANPPAMVPANPPAGTRCAYIYTTNIQNNVFDVYITEFNPATGDCDQGVDLPFKFHVTGRP